MAKRHFLDLLLPLALLLAAIACQLSAEQEQAVQELGNQAGTAAATAAQGIANDAGTAIATVASGLAGDAGTVVATVLAPLSGDDSSGVTDMDNSSTLAYGSSCPIEGPYVRIPENITRLRFRDQPSLDAPIIGYLVGGQCYGLYATTAEWGLIHTSIGSGWVTVDSQFAEVHDTAEPVPVESWFVRLLDDIDNALVPLDTGSAFVDQGVPSGVTLIKGLAEISESFRKDDTESGVRGVVDLGIGGLAGFMVLAAGGIITLPVTGVAATTVAVGSAIGLITLTAIRQFLLK